ncbi:3'-5' exonuclease [Aureimonas sp. SK2]|uniref:3'-5' exonuclease n=1 Tax=Aureimonas sp. SK2 TaxID=3015992 RepID=UPI002443D8FD|nr:3'-5' exonuclease [Aureimonas sp. SK2]
MPVDPQKAYAIRADLIRRHGAEIVAVMNDLSPADGLRAVREVKKKLETAEKATSEALKVSDGPSVGLGAFAIRTEAAGATQWKAIAEKLAADAGVTLDEAFIAPFRSAPTVRVEVRENYDLVDLLKDRPPVVAIDLQTNGFRTSDGVVEVGIAGRDSATGLGYVRQSLVNLEGRPYSRIAANRHGILEEELASAPRWSDIVADFTAPLHGAVLVGHGLVFETRWLDALGVRKTWVAEVDVGIVAQIQKPGLERYDLQALAEAYGVDGRSQYRYCAKDETRIVLAVFNAQAAEAGAL